MRNWGNSTDWIINQIGKEGLTMAADGRKLEYPLHVEIHPHHKKTIMCNNDCEGCTGGKYRDGVDHQFGINTDRLLRTIESFKGKVKRVVFSGCCIEPLLYPSITEVIKASRESDLEFSLYSNFYYANRPGLIDALVDTKKRDFCRISLDAGNARSYNEVHSPRDPKSFERIIENIKRIVSLKNERSSPLNVYITYLLHKANSDPTELEDAVSFAANLRGISAIRFSTYQKPLGQDTPDGIIHDQVSLEKTRRFLKILGDSYRRDDFFLQVGDDDTMSGQKDKTFKRCFVHEVFGVIGFDGGVYPCTAMASPFSPANYRYGNINDEDFFDIWRRKQQSLPFKLDKCYDCTRAEFSINDMFARNQ